MRIRGLLRAGVATMVAAGLAFGTSGVARVAAADYTRYHTYDELTAALRELAKTHANLVKLVDLARRDEGRSVWAIEIGNPAGTPLDERPALLVAANFEGDQLIGSELALFSPRHLAHRLRHRRRQSSSGSTSTSFYIVPRVNPDGAELMFAPLKTGRQDQRREDRRRQRRPRRRGRSGGPERGRRHHDDARQGSARART